MRLSNRELRIWSYLTSNQISGSNLRFAICLEHRTGFEPVSQHWHCRVLPPGPTMLTLNFLPTAPANCLTFFGPGGQS